MFQRKKAAPISFYISLSTSQTEFDHFKKIIQYLPLGANGFFFQNLHRRFLKNSTTVDSQTVSHTITPLMCRSSHSGAKTGPFVSSLARNH